MNNKFYKYSILSTIYMYITVFIFLGVALFIFIDEYKAVPKGGYIINFCVELFLVLFMLLLTIFTMYRFHNSYIYLDIENNRIVLNYIDGRKIYKEEYFGNIERIEYRDNIKNERYSIHIIWKNYDNAFYVNYDYKDITSKKSIKRRMTKYLDYCNKIINEYNQNN